MKLLAFGFFSLFLGLLGLFLWFNDFFIFLKGGTIVILLFTGLVLIYISSNELKNKFF